MIGQVDDVRAVGHLDIGTDRGDPAALDEDDLVGRAGARVRVDQVTHPEGDGLGVEGTRREQDQRGDATEGLEYGSHRGSRATSGAVASGVRGHDW